MTRIEDILKQWAKCVHKAFAGSGIVDKTKRQQVRLAGGGRERAGRATRQEGSDRKGER